MPLIYQVSKLAQSINRKISLVNVTAAFKDLKVLVGAKAEINKREGPRDKSKLSASANVSYQKY